MTPEPIFKVKKKAFAFAAEMVISFIVDEGNLMKKIVIGITGSIASGKSTVLQYLQDRYHAVKLDADEVCHQVLEQPEIIQKLTKEFGFDILKKDGSLDRRSLGRIVFASKEKMAMLEKITRPAIVEKMQKKMEDFRSSGDERICMVEAIDLFGSPLKDWIDVSWTVYADEKIRLKRIMARDGLSEEEALKRIASQMPQEVFMKKADYLIDGGTALEQMYGAIDALMAPLK